LFFSTFALKLLSAGRKQSGRLNWPSSAIEKGKVEKISVSFGVISLSGFLISENIKYNKYEKGTFD